MYTRPPRATPTDALFPYTTLFRTPDNCRSEKVTSETVTATSRATPSRFSVYLSMAPEPKNSGYGPVRTGPYPRLSTYFHLERWKRGIRSEEHTSELQSLMRISYAVF